MATGVGCCVFIPHTQQPPLAALLCLPCSFLGTGRAAAQTPPTLGPGAVLGGGQGMLASRGPRAGCRDWRLKGACPGPQLGCL